MARQFDMKKFVEEWEFGTPVHEMMTRFGIAQRTVYKWVERMRKAGIDLSRRQNQPKTITKTQAIILNMRAEEIQKLRTSISKEYKIIPKENKK